MKYLRTYSSLNKSGLSMALSLVVMAVLSLLLAACGGEATPTVAVSSTRSAPVATKAGSGADPVTLTWSFWGDDTEVAINSRLRKQFEAEYPNIKINMLTETWPKYFDRLKTDWIGDKSPDVMFLDNIPTWAGQGYLEKIEPFVQRDKWDTSDFYPGLLSLFRFNKDLYGLPRDNDTKVIYVNLDMLKEAGVEVPQGGWTWQDLRQAALKLTKRGENGAVERYGFAFEPDTWWKLWVWQNGGELYNDFQAPSPPSKFLLNSPENAEAIQFFADLINVDKVTPRYEDMASGDAIATLFTSRKVAMAFGNHTNIATYGNVRGLRWDVVPLPAGKKRVNVLGGAGYVINKNAKHKDEAWTFIKWLTGPVGQAIFADTGVLVPSRKSVREDNIFLRQQPYNTQVFIQETQLGKPYPEFLLSRDVDTLMDEQIRPVWQGKARASEVLATLPALVEPIFEKGRKLQ